MALYYHSATTPDIFLPGARLETVKTRASAPPFFGETDSFSVRERVSETPRETRNARRGGKLSAFEGAFSSCSASRRGRSARAHRARTSLERRFERRLERPFPSRVLDASSRRPREPRILESSPRARWRPEFPKETSGRFPTRPRLHRAGRLFPRAVTSARARARPAWMRTADPRDGLGARPATWTARAPAPRRTSCSPPRASTRRAGRGTRRRCSGCWTAPNRGCPWTRATPGHGRLCTSPPAGAG